VSNRVSGAFDPAARRKPAARAERLVRINVWTSDPVRRDRVASLIGSLREDSSGDGVGADK
jgi:hypothetical protein